MPLLADHLDRFLQYRERLHEEQSNEVLLYRGQANVNFSVTPSVFRDNLLPHETKMVNELLLQSPEEFLHIMNPYEKLIKMQHYGLPTRLLDMTTNPLVALYFACESFPDVDGEVIVLKDYLERPDKRNVHALALLSEYDGSSEHEMKDFYFERALLDAVRSSGALLEMLGRPYIPVAAPKNNERIKRQHGVFLLFGVDIDNVLNKYQKAPFDIKKEICTDFQDDINRSIVISATDKQQLLDELNAVGINKSFLYPELEHQTDYIQRKYRREV